VFQPSARSFLAKKIRSEEDKKARKAKPRIPGLRRGRRVRGDGNGKEVSWERSRYKKLKYHRSPEPVEGRLSAKHPTITRASTSSALTVSINLMSPMLKGKPVRVLGIKDDYAYRDPVMVAVIKAKFAR
jgi:hypothetical protein